MQDKAFVAAQDSANLNPALRNYPTKLIGRIDILPEISVRNSARPKSFFGLEEGGGILFFYGELRERPPSALRVPLHIHIYGRTNKLYISYLFSPCL